MDGADLIPVQCNANVPNCPPPNPQFAYVDPADVQPYFQLAEQYTFADRMLLSFNTLGNAQPADVSLTHQMSGRINK